MTTADQRHAFGARLRQLRKGQYSARVVADELTAAGWPTTGSNVTAWERGEYGPSDREVVELLEAILSAESGELLALLGYDAGGNLPDRITQLERRVAALEQGQGRRGRSSGARRP